MSNISGTESEILPESDAGAETPSQERAARETRHDDPARPELSVATLVRLLNLPTKLELEVIESKLDAVSAKLSSLTAKLDRLGTQMPQLFSDFDRTNVQIADLREFVRKTMTAMVQHLDAPTALASEIGNSKPSERSELKTKTDSEITVLSSE